MATVCPLCNGLMVLTKKCPLCGGAVKDGGALEDYYGSYSPYEDDRLVLALITSLAPEQWCGHLIYCSECHWDTRILIQQQKTP